MTSQENVTGGYLTYHFNNVGSTMAVTNENGEVRHSYHYSPYGELLEGEYSENIPFLYNGQFGVTTDSNGLYYMRARYYNVDIKRFINQDVLTGMLERISSLNRYAYVEGNPVSYLDPFGLEKCVLDEIHETLQIINMILMVASSLTAVIMVAVPEFFFVGLDLLYTFGETSKAVSAMDALICAGIIFTEAEWNNKVFSMLRSIGFDVLGMGLFEFPILDKGDTLNRNVNAILQNVSNFIESLAGGNE